MVDFRDERLPERFWSKVAVHASGCWMWKAGVSMGYGIYNDGTRIPKRAHRVVYGALVEPIPAHHQVHHECEVKLCVNPAHLRAVTPAEHIQEHPQPLLTHCRRAGHEYTPENTYVNPTGRRECRDCIRERRRERRARLRRESRP